MNSLRFGECLKLLLSYLDISNNRLSKAINVDSSLVNRWINEKRIPSYKTAYIDNIAEYISKNIHNTYQEQRIVNLICKVCGTYDNSVSINDQIKHMLLEAQGNSIESQHKEQQHNAAVRHKKYEDNILSLSKNDKIIFGFDNIIKTGLYLLELASISEPDNDNVIYIAYDSAHHLDIYFKDYTARCASLLMRAIENGWNLVMLIRLVNDTERTINFMKFIRPFIQTGRFKPYYVKNYDSRVTGEILIIIPNIGVLSCFSGSLDDPVNSALYITNSASYHMYIPHFESLLDHTAQPLIENHYGNENYMNLLIKSEESAGNRFLYRYFFDMLTLPEKLFYSLLKRRNLSSYEAEKTMELYEKHRQAFFYNIHHYQYMDIYVSSGIRELIKEHQIYFYCYHGAELMNMETDEIIEHLTYIIDLLEAYDNYNIAFDKQLEEMGSGNKNFYCLIKERQSAIFELLDPSFNMPKIRLSTEEPILVNGIYEYFNTVWEHISPIYKNKKDVIMWLRYEISILNKNI